MATATSQPLGAYAAERTLTQRGAAYRAYRILHAAFIVAPILAGADKFFHLLANWNAYLCEPARQILGEFSDEFMLAVGVIEIVAGLGVALWPRVFAYVVAAWLAGIIVNLLLTGAYYDIALRDFGLALGALALGQLASEFRAPASR